MLPRLSCFLLRLSRLSFYLLLFMLPLSVRWVVVRHHAYGLHPEYISSLFYLIDIPLLLTLAGWLAGMALDANYRPTFRAGPVTLLLGLLAGLSVVSLAWALARPVAATLAINLVVLFGLYLYIQNEIRQRHSRTAARILGASAALQALLAGLQFLTQTPLGLYALGEMKIFVHTPGASVIQVGLEKWRRSYGLFPSPNMLGNFLAVSLLGWLGWQTNRPNSKWVGWLGVAALICLGLLGSFSRAAWLGAIIALAGVAGLLWRWPARRAPVGRLVAAGLGVTLAFVALYPQLFFTRLITPLTSPDTADVLPTAPTEKIDLAQRATYERLAWQVIIHYPGLGAGIGNSPLAASLLSQPYFGERSHQPVHNVALLLTAELGPLGGLIWVSLWASFAWSLWQNRQRLASSPGLIAGSGALIALGVISCFDHSLFTYQQSRILLWTSWGLWASATDDRFEWRWPVIPALPLPAAPAIPLRRRWAELRLVPGLGLTGWAVYRWLLQPRGPFFWDPAGLAVAGLNTLRLFQAGQWAALLEALGKQVTYPPAHPVLLGLFMGLAGSSETSVRLFSLLCLLGGAILVYWLAAQFEQEVLARARAGWLAVGLWLTGATTLFWASEATLEAPGAFFTLVACVAYFRFARQPRLGELALTGLAVSLLLFIKYNYALPLLGGVWLMTLFSPGRWRQRLGQLGVLAGTTLLLPLAWFLADPVVRLGALLDFAINRSSGLDSVANLLFYPQVILFDYAGHWLVGAGLIGGAAYLVYRRRMDSRAQFSALVLLLGLGLAVFHPYKQARFIYPLIPLLGVLGGAGLAELGSVARLVRGGQRILPGVLLASMLLTGLSLPAKLREYQNGVNDRLNYNPAAQQTVNALLDFIEAATRPEQGVLVNGWFNELSESLLRWRWLQHGHSTAQLYGLPYPGATTRQERLAGEADYGALLRDYLQSQQPAFVVSLVVQPESHFYTPDYQNWNAWQSAYSAAMERTPQLELTQAAWFDGGTIQVQIYRYATSDSLPGSLPAGGP